MYCNNAFQWSLVIPNLESCSLVYTVLAAKDTIKNAEVTTNQSDKG